MSGFRYKWDWDWGTFAPLSRRELSETITHPAPFRMAQSEPVKARKDLI